MLLPMSDASVRNLRIDLLRGIGVLLVLFHHFHISYQLDQSVITQIISSDFFNTFINNGYYGVTILFVASGFLITTNSIERYSALHKINISAFYIQRFARIMPCLLLVLALIVAFNMLQISIFKNTPGDTSFFMAVFSVLTFWHNILMSHAGWFNYCLNVFWSLSVTEVFYLTFPLLCLFIKKDRWIFVTLMLLTVAAILYRNYYAKNEIVAMCGNISCLDAISIGCGAAILARKFQLRGRISFFAQLVAISTMLYFYFNTHIMDSIVSGVFLVALSTAVLLLCPENIINFKTSLIKSFTQMIRWCGRHCYEIYLFHIVVLAIMKELCSPGSLNAYTRLGWMAIFFLVTALLAGNIAKFYSQPANKKLRSVLSNFRVH